MTVRRRTISLATVCLMLGLAAAACSSGSSGGEASGPTAKASTAKELTGTALAAAAKADGTLTFYSSYTAKQSGALVKAFNAMYPDVSVNVLHGTASDLTARLNVEQKAQKYTADVFQGDGSYAEQLITAGALQPYTPADIPSPPAGVNLPKGYRNIDAVLTTVIAYNPSALKQAGLSTPTSLTDLTAPAWKGHFSADYAAVNWYESLVASMGHAKALALVRALGKNSLRSVESHTLALTQVESGEPAATIAAYGYLAAKNAKSSNGTLAFVNPNPLPSAADVVELVTKAPHPHAAELFMSWLLSAQGQQALLDTSNRISLHTDVKNDPTAWDPSRWTPAWSLPGLSPTTFNDYTAELKSAFGVA